MTDRLAMTDKPAMTDRLDGKVALVTGAGQGVGQGIAFALAAAGARVAVTGRTLAKLQATCSEIEARGGVALAVQCDVKDAHSLAACVDTVVSHFGGIQILVNNAQEVALGSLLQVNDEALNAGWESGPLATFRLMKLCYPHLKGDGSIINLATSAAKRWDASYYGAYSAVKEAVRALTRAAACEWGRDNIRCNAILPLALSPGLKGWMESSAAEAEKFTASVPMKRVGDCEQDIGRFVVLLCSSGAAYVNGQSIGLDGGQALLG